MVFVKILRKTFSQSGIDHSPMNRMEIICIGTHRVSSLSLCIEEQDKTVQRLQQNLGDVSQIWNPVFCFPENVVHGLFPCFVLLKSFTKRQWDSRFVSPEPASFLEGP
ncbi:MAG TPA: hypothetical protein DIT94_12445 [Deltaproteobacteria bacterium]|nr:hypothetical protein [Deltaproteobacteria bacterium]HCP35196.1 hypothetical protein [Deltaproteobacteria bacterium]